jgi:4-amino-4-deoxy-L-arabinose transferase-like glycosyltransferase
MDDQAATNSSRSLLFRLWPWLVLLLVLLFVAFIRFRLLDLPLERDEGEYAYAGQLILQGIPPYELAYNMKLPGTYFAYATGMAIFGQTIAGIHLTLIVVNSLTTVFVFLLGRKLFGTVAGLIASATFGILSVSPVVLGMAAHANHFVILFAVPATLLLWQTTESNKRRLLFFSGLLYGLAFVMKQQGACFGLFACGFLVWQESRKSAHDWPGFAQRFFLLGVGMLLPFALTCFILALAGVFSRFWFWTFTYAGAYAAHETLIGGFWLLHEFFQTTWKAYAGFLILAAGLPLLLRRKTIQSQTVFCAGFLIFSFLGTAIGFYFRRHYFILTLPAFAVLTGASVASLRHVLKSPVAKAMPLLAFAAALGWNIFLQKNYFFQLSTLQVSRLIYGENPLVESLTVAKYIQTHSSDSARMAVIGSEPQIYFYAHRHSATGYIYTYPLMEHQPYAVRMQREMIREIESNRPEYIVLVAYRYSWLFTDTSDLTIINWFNEYSGQFYQITGITDTRADGEMIWLEDEQAKNYHGALNQHLIIYKRKPDAD